MQKLIKLPYEGGRWDMDGYRMHKLQTCLPCLICGRWTKKHQTPTKVWPGTIETGHVCTVFLGW